MEHHAASRRAVLAAAFLLPPWWMERAAAAAHRRDADLANHRRDADLANERRDADLANERRDADLANERRDADLANERRDADLANERRDAALVNRRHAPPPRRAPHLVMLDPGHGGKDPGAVGVSGTFEKNVSLAAAFELKRQLEATGLYRVQMTRQSDVFIPLDDRVERARRQQSALFVSMHADALSDHEVRGASVYTLARTASDAQTAQLARRENSADRYAGLPGQPPEVAAILDSLIRTETRVGSARMARDMVGAFRNTIPVLENPARHAEFAVLKAADIPSVLVEMGFMSNATDEAALRQASHRTRVAAAMKQAVDAYFASAGVLAG